jgi:hypothetical protein
MKRLEIHTNLNLMVLIRFSALGALLGTVLLSWVSPVEGYARLRPFRKISHVQEPEVGRDGVPSNDPGYAPPSFKSFRKKRPKISDLPSPSPVTFNSYTQILGPTADFAYPLESYSIFSDFYEPMSWLQVLGLQFSLSNSISTGFDLSGLQYLSAQVPNQFGGVYNSSFSFFDPTVYLSFGNLIDTPLLSMFGRVSSDLPFSEFSRNIRALPSLNFSQGWRFKTGLRRLSFGFNTFQALYFYENSAGYTTSRFNVGHYLSYELAQNWAIENFSVFDFAHQAISPGMIRSNPGNVDHFRTSLKHRMLAGKATLGFFIQTPVYYRVLRRTSLGLDFSFSI